MKHFFKTFNMTMLLVGTVVGAGFASGAEIVKFFGILGWWGIPCAIIAGVLMFLIILLFLKTAEIVGKGDVHSINRAVFPNSHIVMDIIIPFNYLIITASMFGAADALFAPYTPFPFAGLITLALVFLAAYFGISGLQKANMALVPLLAVLLAVVCVFNIAAPDGGYYASKGAAAVQYLLHAPVYAGMNMLLSAGVIFGLKTDKKTAFRAALWSCVIITAFIILIILALFAGGKGAQSAELPIMVLAGRMNFTWPAMIVIWVGIFTSASASAYALHQSARQYIKNKALSLLAVLAAGYAVSRLGFSAIIALFYPISGIIGIIFAVYAAIFVIKNRYQGTSKDAIKSSPLMSM